MSAVACLGLIMSQQSVCIDETVPMAFDTPLEPGQASQGVTCSYQQPANSW